MAAKISIIMPAYNAEKTLMRAIESVQDQTIEAWELFIVDDASQDATRRLAQEASEKDARIKLISLSQNSRQSFARNCGIEASRAPWITFLDADDAYTPNRLCVLFDHAVQNDLDMIADNQLFYDASCKKISRRALPEKKTPYKWTLLSHLKNEKIGSPFKWGLLKPMVKREFLMKNNIFFRREFFMGEDSLFQMEILVQGARAEILSEAGYIYTLSRGEISRKSAGTSTSRYKIEEHVVTYDYFYGAYEEKMTREEKTALKECKKAAFVSNEYLKFKEYVMRASFVSALTCLWRCPSLLFFIYYALRKYVFSLYRKVFPYVDSVSGLR